MEAKAVTAVKFSRAARGWSEKEYQDLSGLMERRAMMVRHWGAALQPGDRILELGCGDGMLACLLAAQGFAVTAVDISPGMIEEAKEHAAKLGVSVCFEVADSDNFASEGPFDAVVSFMSAFFTYLEDPHRFLRMIVPLTRKKVIVDWNFRSPCSFVEAAQLLREAGLERLEWRPWLVPYTTKRASGSGFRNWLEDRPNLCLPLLILKRWHYTVHLKGEKMNGELISGGANGVSSVKGSAISGNSLQSGLAQIGRSKK